MAKKIVQKSKAQLSRREKTIIASLIIAVPLVAYVLYSQYQYAIRHPSGNTVMGVLMAEDMRKVEEQKKKIEPKGSYIASVMPGYILNYYNEKKYTKEFAAKNYSKILEDNKVPYAVTYYVGGQFIDQMTMGGPAISMQDGAETGMSELAGTVRIYGCDTYSGFGNFIFGVGNIKDQPRTFAQVQTDMQEATGAANKWLSDWRKIPGTELQTSEAMGGGKNIIENLVLNDGTKAIYLEYDSRLGPNNIDEHYNHQWFALQSLIIFEKNDKRIMASLYSNCVDHSKNNLQVNILKQELTKAANGIIQVK